jgi:hypothetical protein
MYKERFEDSKWIIRGHNSNAYHKLDKEKTKRLSVPASFVILKDIILIILVESESALCNLRHRFPDSKTGW